LGDEYHIGWHLVKASEYGVPQNRPRVLLVGARKCLKWKPVLGGQDEIGLLHKGPKRAGGLLPEQIEDLAPPSLWELLSDLVEEPHTNGGETEVYPQSAGSEISKRLRTWPGEGKHRAKGKPVSDHKYSKHSDRIERKFKKMIEHGKLPDDKEHERLATKKFAQRVLPKDWGDNGPTITATSLPDDYVHFSQPRILTVREWARLQLFPDWYKFEGKRTTGGIRRAGNPRDEVFDREVPKYTQIGNAVPVGLAEQIGLRFKDILDGKG
jgi:DNA (cytosine-5)-methyltransferase 1